ncbi:MAG: bacterioferritin [Myxococcota bacterium]
MKGDAKVIELLNEVLTGELTAVNQYWLHGRMCENWGYERLWKKLRHESIEEMQHADELTARILYLEGVPNLQRYGKLTIGETVEEQLELDLKLEYAALERLNRGIAMCREVGDNGSRALLEKILVSEEDHVDWIEAQRDQIAQMGLPNYLAQQVKADEEG